MNIPPSEINLSDIITQVHNNSVYNEEHSKFDVFMLSMSNCKPCMNAKKFLRESGIDFESIDLDKAGGDDWDRIFDVVGDFLPSHGMPMIFPMIIIKEEKILYGFQEEKILEAINTYTDTKSTNSSMHE